MKGILVDESKEPRNRETRVLRKRKELRSYIGFASYYRQIILGFAKISKPFV